VEWALNYADLSNSIGIPKSHHEGSLTGKGIIGKKAITPYPHLFRCAYFHVLQQMSIVSEYFDEHKEVLLINNPGCNESWLANEHIRKFIGWFWDGISQSLDSQTTEYLKMLSRGPIFTFVTNQGYGINGYTFYTKQQDKKNTYQNSGVRVDSYEAMGQDKNMYYGQIQDIWEFDSHGFKIPLFRCNWVDAIRGVVQDKYGFISVDLNHQGYELETFVLAKHVAQVFYVPDTTNKRLNMVIPGKH
jgi:hypothetical protein